MNKIKNLPIHFFDMSFALWYSRGRWLFEVSLRCSSAVASLLPHRQGPIALGPTTEGKEKTIGDIHCKFFILI